MKIQKADLQNIKLREKLLKYLKPHEKVTIQIIVHIKNPKTWCHVYYVQDLKNIVGVAVYLNPFKSFSLFGKDENVIQNLTKKVLESHIVKIFMSDTFIGKIAYNEFEKHGYKSIVNPYNELLLVLDLDDFNPIYLKNENIRLLNKKDAKSIAGLSKHLKSHENNKNIDQEDLDRIFYYFKAYVLEKENKVVSIVASDGIGFDYFQVMHLTHSP